MAHRRRANVNQARFGGLVDVGSVTSDFPSTNEGPDSRMAAVIRVSIDWCLPHGWLSWNGGYRRAELWLSTLAMRSCPVGRRRSIGSEPIADCKKWTVGLRKYRK